MFLTKTSFYFSEKYLKATNFVVLMFTFLGHRRTGNKHLYAIYENNPSNRSGANGSHIHPFIYIYIRTYMLRTKQCKICSVLVMS